jgi:hypothetical protein
LPFNYGPISEGGSVNIEIRPAVSADAQTCGRIIYEAFKGIAERNGFPNRFLLTGE